VTEEASEVKGETLYTETRKIPVVVGGLVARVVTVVRDITEARRAQEKRRRLEDQLYKSQKLEAIGRLAGGVAHDFNNLLSPILGVSSQLLTKTSGAEQGSEGIEVIHQAAVRARSLVQQLLAVGRGQVLDLEPVDLRGVIAGFEKILRQSIRDNVRIEYHLPESIRRVRADAGRIEQVLLNLALNAQDAMPDGGVLTIELSDSQTGGPPTSAHPEVSAEGWVRLSVRDTGRGMDRQTLDFLFEPFFSTKAPGMGAGLGLSVVYGLVKQHGGHVLVSSEPGQGTTLEIYLPSLAAPAEAVRAPGRPRKQSAVESGQKILVVEDTPALREMTRQMLESFGCRVRAVESGESCLEVVEEGDWSSFDLLVTDVSMPRMDGFELYRQLRMRRPGLRVVFMSGYEYNPAERGITGREVHFLRKPFTIQELNERIREALDTVRA